tara:strand:- start:1086 stop:2000 length:915 start_codon:yes stop_codon:yes gene_type:complete
MIYTAENPGNWSQWKQKPENKNLPLTEAKQKFLKEQLLFEDQYTNFVATQQAIQQQKAQTGGVSLNGVSAVAFDTLPVFQTNTGNTQTLKVNFAKPVIITGNPTVEVANNQFGGGTEATFNYTFSAGSGTTELTFQHIHPTAIVTSQGFSANVVANAVDLVSAGGTVVQPGTPVDEVYTFAANTNYTTSGAGKDIAMTVEVVGGNIIEVNVTAIGNDFIPNEVITFADGQLGAGSTGGSVTVVASVLQADTVSFAAGSAVSLAGGTIKTGDGASFNTQYNDINRRQGTPSLGFSSTSTKTGVAS